MSVINYFHFYLIAALGGTRPEDDFNEANKRHTMSHPPEHIPDIDSQTPAKVKSPKEIKDKKVKDKVGTLLLRSGSGFVLFFLSFETVNKN